MLSNFAPCLALLLKTEGGYVNNPKDPGGATYKGITLATAKADISPTITAASLRYITDEQIATVYRTMYADRVRFDALPSGLDYTALDYAANSGYGRVNRVLRQLVGAPPGTSMDLATVDLIKKRNPADLIRAVNKERLAFMQGLSTWKTFGKGWTNRVNGVLAHSLAMAAQGTFGVVDPATEAQLASTDSATAKAKPTADKTSIVSGAAGSVGAAGTAIAHWHPNGYVGMAIAFAAVGLFAFVVYLANKHSEIAAVTPAPGTAVVPAVKTA